MSCWHGHIPGMSEEQLAQATRAYYRAAYGENWQRAWQSPMNPFTTSQTINPEWDRAEPTEPPASKERRQTSLQEASASDKAGAIEVECVRVR